MKHLHALVLGVVASLVCSVGTAHAQFKFPTPAASKAAKDVTFEQVKDTADLKHGTLVSVELNNGDKVTGNVVRFDAKSNTVFVRTAAGKAPVAVAESDVKKMDKGVRQTPKGARNVVNPEIFQQVGVNGTHRTVTYSSKVLSPAEREVLEQLQKAENARATLAHHDDLRDRAMNQELAVADERVKMQRLINQTLQWENWVNYPYPPATIYDAGHRTLNAYKGVISVLPPVMPLAGVAAMIPVVEPQAMANALKAWADLQKKAVYEDGRLIAVIP
jgi:hypothetical protein